MVVRSSKNAQHSSLYFHSKHIWLAQNPPWKMGIWILGLNANDPIHVIWLKFCNYQKKKSLIFQRFKIIWNVRQNFNGLKIMEVPPSLVPETYMVFGICQCIWIWFEKISQILTRAQQMAECRKAQLSHSLTWMTKRVKYQHSEWKVLSPLPPPALGKRSPLCES